MPAHNGLVFPHPIVDLCAWKPLVLAISAFPQVLPSWPMLAVVHELAKTAEQCIWVQGFNKVPLYHVWTIFMVTRENGGWGGSRSCLSPRSSLQFTVPSSSSMQDPGTVATLLPAEETQPQCQRSQPMAAPRKARRVSTAQTTLATQMLCRCACQRAGGSAGMRFVWFSMYPSVQPMSALPTWGHAWSEAP